MDVQRDYAAAIGLALVSEISEDVLGEKEPAEAQFRLILLVSRAIRVHGPSQVVLAYFSLWTARLGGWLGPLDRCAKCGKDLQGTLAHRATGGAELFCENCRTDWARSVSKEGLAIGRAIISGKLEQVLKENHSMAAAKEILDYALDILEHHIEKKLVSRKPFELGESGLIEI
jgi:recombinational DNA repair protein (RecF pathway)